MFKLGFCVYGPQCRYRHTRVSGPPPDPSTLEAAKPRDFRNINVVVNSVNTGIASSDRPGSTAGRGRGQGRWVSRSPCFQVVVRHQDFAPDKGLQHCRNTYGTFALSN